MSLRDLQLRLEHGRGEADDWTKIGDKTLRKTIQNRLAQRKRRAFTEWNMPALCNNMMQHRHKVVERQSAKARRATYSANSYG